MSSVNRGSWFKEITLSLNQKATTLLPKIVSSKKYIDFSIFASDEKKKKNIGKRSASVQPFNNHEIREAYGETRLKY